ncbi:hypothetical protein EVAR_84333_1 [Eumeta japonica]|uniref:Uncharacterized protein n=1 Tax=Eumeta variegata TaxID=151549 RepID=A0A4C1U4N7_EUMVA|nr:hypothetical protein EVAR_84333_1 [Eumeta japonica]
MYYYVDTVIADADEHQRGDGAKRFKGTPGGEGLRLREASKLNFRVVRSPAARPVGAHRGMKCLFTSLPMWKRDRYTRERLLTNSFDARCMRPRLFHRLYDDKQASARYYGAVRRQDQTIKIFSPLFHPESFYFISMVHVPLRSRRSRPLRAVVTGDDGRSPQLNAPSQTRS